MIELSRRQLLHVTAGAASLCVAPGAATAQNWPSGTLRLIVPYAAGGSADTIARLVQPNLQHALGVSMVIENRTGAAGSIGAGIVAKSPPDGSTWLLDFDNHAANAFTIPNLPYDTEKDFAPVQLIGTAPYVLCTHPSRPFATPAGLISAAKAKPSTITYGTVGAGSVGHLAMVMLEQRAGISLVHVPYRGGSAAINDLIGGHVDTVMGSSALTLPQLNSGTIKPVFQTGSARLPALPNVATVSESFPGFDAYAWWAIFAPAGTPAGIIDRFGSEFAKSLRDERVLKQVVETQQISVALHGPEELRAFVAAQMKQWGAVVRDSGLKFNG